MWQDEWKDRSIPEAEWPVVRDSDTYLITRIHRRTAWENRPGYKMLRVRIVRDGQPIGGVFVRFDTQPSEGIAFDHPNIWGVTGRKEGNLGYIEWDTFGIPTRYRLFTDDSDEPLIDNIRTDLGNEYPVPPGAVEPTSWRPTNRPGFYSYDIESKLGHLTYRAEEVRRTAPKGWEATAIGIVAYLPLAVGALYIFLKVVQLFR